MEELRVSVQAGNKGSKMLVEYCIVLGDAGWMIEREGQLYGPYPSQQNAVSEAFYGRII
jgi:hypothetical protein